MASSKLPLGNILLSIFLLSVAGFSGWQFYTELNREVTNVDGVQVGSVSVVQGRAERRFERQTKWGSVRGAESLYNLDAIRTTGESGAVLELHYVDEAGVEKTDELVLGPDTYIVLDLLGETRNIQFVGGDLSASGEEGLTVSAGETVVAVADGSVNLGRAEGQETSVTVTKGEARVNTIAGETIVSSEESLTINEENGETNRREVAVNPRLPGANALLLTYGNTRNVNFAWDQFAAWKEPTLEVSADALFNENISPVFRSSGDGSASLDLTTSRWFWRVTDAETGESGPVLLFTVDTERMIEAVSPADGTVIPFRGEIPEVSIQWRQTYFADNYTVELSRNESFATVLSEAETNSGATLIKNLAEGIWWWRATPRYGRAQLDTPPLSTGGSFNLERRLGHDPVKLVSPAEDLSFSGINVRDGIDFRWQKDPDIVDYRIQVATDSRFDTIIADSDTPENFKKGLLPAPEDNTYYWRVSATAADGQAVPISETRQFNVTPITGSVELIDPSAGEIKEVESYAAQTFLWRATVSGTARFLLERISNAVSDERIKIMETLVNGTNFTAPLPGEGSYIWKVQILDTGGRVLVESPEARFRLRSEFGAPVLKEPAPGSTVNLVGSTAIDIAWNPAPSADTYKVVLRGPNGNVIGRDDRISGLGREFALPSSAVAGEYIVELSSIRNNPPSGASGESEAAIYRFSVGNLVRYSAAVPTSPENGAFIPGLDARTDGITLRWNQNPSLGYWRVELSNGLLTRVYETPKPNLTLEDLRPGSYTWLVRSSDSLGQDAPDSSTSRFIVGDVPNPANPVVTSPSAGEVRDMTGANRLVFEWEPSANSEFYDIALYVEGSSIPVLRETGLTGTRYVLRNLRILDVGDYILTIQARAEYEEVGLNLKSKMESIPFSLSLNISGDAPDILTNELQYAE